MRRKTEGEREREREREKGGEKSGQAITTIVGAFFYNAGIEGGGDNRAASRAGG
jgi:hypothetical protein